MNSYAESAVNDHAKAADGQLNNGLPTMTLNLTSKPTEFQGESLAGNAVEQEDAFRQLANENAELKAAIQHNNDAMRRVLDTMKVADAKAAADRRANEEQCEQARTVVMTLRRKIGEQERVIQQLRQQVVPLPAVTADFPTEEMSTLQAEVSKMAAELGQLQQLRADIAEFQRDNTRLQHENTGLQRELEACRAQTAEERVNHLRNKASMDEIIQELIIQNERKTKEEVQSNAKAYESKADHLIAQLISAEDTLQMKDDQIVELKKQIAKTDDLMQDLRRQINELSNSNAILAEQARVHRADFEEERACRERLIGEKEELKECVAQLEAQLSLAGSTGPPNGPPNPYPPSYGVIPLHREVTPPRHLPYSLSGGGGESSAFPMMVATGSGGRGGEGIGLQYPYMPPGGLDAFRNPYPEDFPAPALTPTPPLRNSPPRHGVSHAPIREESPRHIVTPLNRPPPSAMRMGVGPEEGGGGPQPIVGGGTTPSEGVQQPPTLPEPLSLDFICPMCGHVSPDGDSNTLHFNDNHGDMLR